MNESACQVQDFCLRVPWFVEWLLKIKIWFVSVSCMIMATTFFFIVILRYGFEADLFAYEEWLLAGAFWFFFLGSAIGSFEQTHIRADLVSSILKGPPAKLVHRTFVLSIECFVLCALVYWSAIMMYEEFGSYPYWQTTIALKIPFAIPRLAILIGFVFMLFYTMLHLYATVSSWRLYLSDRDPR